MKYLSLFSIIFIYSCSQTVENKNYQAFERVSYLEQGQRPEFYFSKVNTNSRAPASVESDEDSLSLRALYFSSLWRQKKQMESILAIESNNYCPAFHQQVLNQKNLSSESFMSFNQMHSKIINDKNPLVYPILALPYEGADVYSYSEKNRLTPSVLKAAFTEYYKITSKEIDSLCETGVSEGYFMTKNLTDYYVAKNAFNSSKEHLEAILKTPYVANLYVLSSFKNTKSLDNYSLLYNLKANWFIGYLDTLKQARNNRIVKNFK